MRPPQLPNLTPERVSEFKQRLKSCSLSEQDRDSLVKLVDFTQQIAKIIRVTEPPMD